MYTHRHAYNYTFRVYTHICHICIHTCLKRKNVYLFNVKNNKVKTWSNNKHPVQWSPVVIIRPRCARGLMAHPGSVRPTRH